MKLGKKLILGFSSVLMLFVVAISISYWGLESSVKTANHLEERYKQLRMIDDLKEMNVRLNLIFMDIIVNKEKNVSQKQLNALKNFKKELNNDKAALLLAADTKAKKEQLVTILQRTRELLKLGDSELIPNVGIGKVVESTFFDAIDNKIDSITQKNATVINSIIQQELSELQTAKQEEQSTTYMIELVLIITLGIGIVVGVLIALYITRNILKQLGGEPSVIQNIAETIATGHFNVELHSDRKEVTGTFAAMIQMVENLNRVAEIARRIAQGDLTVQISSEEAGTIFSVMQNMILKLQSVVGETIEVSTTLAATSEEINATANSLSESSQNQATNVEEASTAIEQLTASVKQVASHTNTMQEKSDHSLQEAKTYEISIQQITEEMIEVNECSKQVGNIVQVIKDIADQTSLLSLNAAIEAARAGEHGRGFAVVADAISALATRSANSTKEIEKLVKTAITSITSGVNSVKTSSESFALIIKTIEENNIMANEIAKAMEEQSAGSEQMQKATDDINSLTQNVSACAEEMTGSTAEFQKLAERLNSIICEFTIDADQEEISKGVVLKTVA